MPTSIAPARLALGHAILPALPPALERELPAQGPGLLREIGFAAGEALYQGFVGSVAERYGVEPPQGLDARFLGEALAGYFRDEGWGSVATDQLAPEILAFDSPDWVE